MRISATEVLRNYVAHSIQQMARLRGLTIKSTSKETIIQALAAKLYDPEGVRRALEDLTPLERLMLNRLILAGGDVPTALIRGQLNREHLIHRPSAEERQAHRSYYRPPETGSARASGSNKFEDLVARLGGLGLVFTAEPVQSSGSIVELGKPGRRLFIPDDILSQLPTVTLPVETVAAPAEVSEGDAGPLLRDLYHILSFAAREPIPLTAKGLINKRTLARLADGLRRPEDIAAVRSEDELEWLPLLRGLAEELGLLAASVGELVLDQERAAEFLRLPAGGRRERLFAAYRRTARWCELYRIPDLAISGKGGSPRSAPAPVVTARQRVLAEVAELPVGEWITLDHLTQRLRLRAYEFLLPRRGAPSYYYGYLYDDDHGYGYQANPYRGDNQLGLTFDVQGNEQDGWNLVEAGFIELIVSYPLYHMGVVDIAGGDSTPKLFRITEDGGRLLRWESLPSVAATPHVVIQPNFQIFAFEPTGEDVLFTLDQLADRVRSEQAIEYELTRDSVYRAQRGGMDAGAVIAFLESVSTVALPQNVRRSLEEWGGQIERITVRRRAPVLQVGDPASLDALYADAELAPLLGRRVAPDVAIVSSANLRELCNRLVNRGRLPALSEGANDPGAVLRPRLDVDAEGGITFRQRLPSIFDLSRLRPFADTVEADGVTRLSPASLRRGARNKLSADEIVTTLESLHGGPLPAESAAFVRRWAKDWGHGALVEAIVLQVDQAATLTDLLSDPEIKPHLQPIPGAPTLATVRPESADHLRALLDARGMTLGDRLLR